jgi:hypothetical protein
MRLPHAGPLSRDVVEDLMTNERTPTFRRPNASDVETRFYNLGKWIGSEDEDGVRDENEEMGRIRFREGVPVRELVYALLILKSHLRRYIREHGLVDFAGDRVAPRSCCRSSCTASRTSTIGEFFDRALYHLARGFEAEALDAARRPSDVRDDLIDHHHRRRAGATGRSPKWYARRTAKLVTK